MVSLRPVPSLPLDQTKDTTDTQTQAEPEPGTENRQKIALTLYHLTRRRRATRRRTRTRLPCRRPRYGRTTSLRRAGGDGLSFLPEVMWMRWVGWDGHGGGMRVVRWAPGRRLVLELRNVWLSDGEL